MKSITCYNCKLQWICKIKENFEKPLLDTRHCIERGEYPDLCGEFYMLLAKFCNLFQMQDQDYAGEEDDE